MSLIKTVGAYLGYATSHGVGTTKNEYPQLVLQCEATHYYDEDIDDYVEITEDTELRAYLVLYGKDQKPLRNCEQVKNVFGWDGLSFQTLAEMPLHETRFLFRVEENDYNPDNTTLQISWIDSDDASPTRQISSLDTKSLKGLDAKFGLTKVGKKTDTPKPTGKPKPPKTTKKKDTKKVEEKKEPETVTDVTNSGPPAPAPIKGEPDPAVGKKTGSTTREDAWDYIEEQIPEAALSAEDRAIAWNKAIETIHHGPDDDTLTPGEWFLVQELVISEAIPY